LKINVAAHNLWRAVDHQGEVLEGYVTKCRDRKAALNCLRKLVKRYDKPKVIVTDKLRTCGAEMKIIGNAGRQETGRWLNNRAENSHPLLAVACLQTMRRGPSGDGNERYYAFVGWEAHRYSSPFMRQH